MPRTGYSFTGPILVSRLTGLDVTMALTHAVTGAGLSLAAFGTQGPLVSGTGPGSTLEEVDLG